MDKSGSLAIALRANRKPKRTSFLGDAIRGVENSMPGGLSRNLSLSRSASHTFGSRVIENNSNVMRGGAVGAGKGTKGPGTTSSLFRKVATSGQ